VVEPRPAQGEGEVPGTGAAAHWRTKGLVKGVPCVAYWSHSPFGLWLWFDKGGVVERAFVVGE